MWQTQKDNALWECKNYYPRNERNKTFHDSKWGMEDPLPTSITLIKVQKLILTDRDLILQMVKTKTTVKRASTLWEYTQLQRARFPAATSRSRAWRHRSIIHGQPKRKQTGRAPVEPPIATEVEPEIQMGTEPEEQRDMEVQAQTVHVSLRGACR